MQKREKTLTYVTKNKGKTNSHKSFTALEIKNSPIRRLQVVKETQQLLPKDSAKIIQQ